MVLENIPDDHLCSLTGTQDHLSLELIALCDSQFFHRADDPIIHV